MNRNSSSDGGPDMKRPESYSSPLTYKQQQILSPQQQKQIQAQQQIQQQQYQAQQQQQFQMQQQIQEFQQQRQQQQQQIQEYQQQQQYAANQQYYNQAAFYNYQPYVPSQSPLLYNNGPSWNYIPPPPQYFGSSPSPSTSQPPLPPPDLKPEKPPLPKEPEPGNENKMGIRNGGVGTLGSGPSGVNSPRPQGAIRVRGLNGINAGIFNGINTGIRPNGSKNRRKNPHFFSQMQPPPAPLAQDLTQIGDFSDLAKLLDEDIPSGADKFTIFLNNTETGRVQVNKKAKRKPMSTRYARTKVWVREEAEAALALEKEFNRMQKRPMLILKFPDPDLNKYIVKKYSPLIETVHFQQPSTPRYCFVQLKDDADVEKVANTIRQIPFGTGKISAEIKSHHLDDQPVSAEEIDPYTLYIGNLPTHISVRVVKQYFPNAQRIDIGYAQRMRYTRYAFIRYNTVAEAMDSYRKTVNALLDSRSLIVRFRRQKGNIGLPGEPKLKLQKLEDKKEPAFVVRNATENDDEVQIVDDLAEEDRSVAEDGVGGEKGEKVSKQVQEKIGKLETVSEESLSTPAADDVNPKSTTETDEENQASSARELNDNAKYVTNPPVQKGTTVPASMEKQITNSETGETLATLYSPESLGDEADNKEKVLEEARELMKKNQELRAVSPINFSAFTQPTDLAKGPVEGDIKLEQSEDEDSSDDGGINLLGTRIKDEPFETPHRAPIDELYFDDYDYDDLCTDIEDDDDNWSTNSDSRSRQLLATNWELVRRSELNVREDKPDLSEMGNLGASSKQAPIKIAPIKISPEPKQEIDDLEQQAVKKMKRDQLAVKQELEDMFNRLNSDIECDDEDAFFGHT